jgi:regulator of sigma E protease
MTVIIFIIVLAVLIFVHEFGHFLTAKAFGVRVDAFAVGLGPKIISWRDKETIYSVNLIPFGGYVKIFGENPDEESISGPDSARSFVSAARWKQIIILASGVIGNFIFAWLLYIAVFTNGVTATTDGFGQYANKFTNSRIMIAQVLPGSPADRAGIQAGDTVDSVTGTGAKQSIEDIQNAINSSGNNPITLNFNRNGETKTAEIIPVNGLVEGKYAVGIAMQNVADLKLPFFTSIYEGGHYAITMIKETAVSLGAFIANIFRGTANFSDVAGPIGIAGIIGGAAKLGFTYLIMITAIISINLGIINLIPFPALDGGRILFVAIEGIIRRRIPAKFANIVNGVGFALLMALMALVTYKDMAKLLVK